MSERIPHMVQVGDRIFDAAAVLYGRYNAKNGDKALARLRLYLKGQEIVKQKNEKGELTGHVMKANSRLDFDGEEAEKTWACLRAKAAENLELTNMGGKQIRGDA